MAEFLISLLPVVFDLIDVNAEANDDDSALQRPVVVGKEVLGNVEDDGEKKSKKKADNLVDRVGLWKELASVENCFLDNGFAKRRKSSPRNDAEGTELSHLEL